MVTDIVIQAGVGRPEHDAWPAYVDSQLAGQILVHEKWYRLI